MPSADSGSVQTDAFVLHRWPWRESSLIVELFTATLGRVTAIAKGARRPTSPQRGQLQPFLPLTVRLVGRSDVKNLSRLQTRSPAQGLSAECLGSGYYLNELLLALTPRALPEPQLFQAYEDCLAALRDEVDYAALRFFEKRILAIVGHAPSFAVQGADRVDPERAYVLTDDLGWMPASEVGRLSPDEFRVRGKVLCAIEGESFLRDSPEAKSSEIRRTLQYLLNRAAPGVGGRSRQVGLELAALSSSKLPSRRRVS
jgi:DNA repair protein RecO (recombination protein O)